MTPAQGVTGPRQNAGVRKSGRLRSRAVVHRQLGADGARVSAGTRAARASGAQLHPGEVPHANEARVGTTPDAHGRAAATATARTALTTVASRAPRAPRAAQGAVVLVVNGVLPGRGATSSASTSGTSKTSPATRTGCTARAAALGPQRDTGEPYI
jgi:hypothetical protein